MTRIEFIFNVVDKMATTLALCQQNGTKGRQITVLTESVATSEALQQRLWQESPTSFLPSVLSSPLASQTPYVQTPILLDDTGEALWQDDILLNLKTTLPKSFARYQHLIELVGKSDIDKQAARERFKFYKTRGYEIKSTDASLSN